MSRARPVLWLCALALLYAQSALLWHGVEHPFHEPDSFCQSFIAAEHQGHALPPLLPPASLPPPRVWAHVLPETGAVLGFIPAFRARAPPFLISL